MDETPQDMADFVEYVNGPADSAWGKQRVADGHPGPIGLKYIELGNEEAVNEAYWERFKPMAEAMWPADPTIILVVGDFAYGRAHRRPVRLSGLRASRAWPPTRRSSTSPAARTGRSGSTCTSGTMPRAIATSSSSSSAS